MQLKAFEKLNNDLGNLCKSSDNNIPNEYEKRAKIKAAAQSILVLVIYI